MAEASIYDEGNWRRITALFPLGFLVLIVVGAIILEIPKTRQLGRMDEIESLFTVTSAVCCVGLSVRDVHTQFQPLGQAIIGILIELGALWYMTYGTAVVLRINAALRANRSGEPALALPPPVTFGELASRVVTTALVIQLLGAAAMTYLWDGSSLPPDRDHFFGRLHVSLFQSISAYCNAGFTLTSGNLQSYRYSALTHLIVAPLIVMGSLGYPVLAEIGRWCLSLVGLDRGDPAPSAAVAPPPPGKRQPAPPPRPVARQRFEFSPMVRLLLVSWAAVYLLGTITILGGDLVPYAYPKLFGSTENRTRNKLPPLLPLSEGIPLIGAHLADASFLSISARTAGFESRPMAEVGAPGKVAVGMLMAVGGNPGGAAGGMTVLCAALIILALVAAIRRRPVVKYHNTIITQPLLGGALLMASAFFLLVALSVYLLTLFEAQPLDKLFFEALSAASGTGLSYDLDVSPDLYRFGRWLIVFLMILGRLLPIMLLARVAVLDKSVRPAEAPALVANGTKAKRV